MSKLAIDLDNMAVIK